MPRVQVIASREDATDPTGSERTAILQPFPVPGAPDGDWMTDGKPDPGAASYFLRLTHPDGRVAYSQQNGCGATPETARETLAKQYTDNRVAPFQAHITDPSFLRKSLEDWEADRCRMAPLLQARWILGAEYVNPIVDRVYAKRKVEREAEEAEREAERKRKAEEADREALAKALRSFRANGQLSATQWERLAALVGYEWHPRTLGSLRKNVVEKAPDGRGIIRRTRTGSLPDLSGVHRALCAIGYMLKEREAPPDPQEATPEQLAHLFGKA